MLREREVVRNTGKEAIGSFLESQTCYSVLRASGKVVVFDTRIPIQLAFYALVEHGEFILCAEFILLLCSYSGLMTHIKREECVLVVRFVITHIKC